MVIVRLHSVPSKTGTHDVMFGLKVHDATFLQAYKQRHRALDTGNSSL